ncbi:hypothetical protein DCAR_0208684 [Daucus carota subsp. sativus]|uniref:Reverse transcriptase domain-containing protein n=1 Tax=Daucus carota subsp. sativus TaxID=79200 RepID=A0AAF1AR94_DAUCS|nr:hypothetical protein DCAR_0208684 [Daucus carota subsp. sativus]
MLTDFLIQKGLSEKADRLNISEVLEPISPKKIAAEKRDLILFIWDHKELVHPNVLKNVRQDDEESINLALRHIHYGSLQKAREIKKKEAESSKIEADEVKKGYKEALLRPTFNKPLRFVDKGGEKKSKGLAPNKTVFVYNIPAEAKVQEIWKGLKAWGKVLDISLPIKKDKFGRRFGFARLASLNEAEKFISSANGKFFQGNQLKVQYAKDFKKDKAGSSPPSRVESNGGSVESYPDAGFNLASPTKFLEFEARKDLEEEIGRSMVIELWKPSSVTEVVDTLEMLGFVNIVVRGISSFKFLLTWDSVEKLEETDIELLSLGFLSCKKASWRDIIPNRRAIIECTGMPWVCWNLSNLSKILQEWGRICAISNPTNMDMTFHNPVVIIDTSCYENPSEGEAEVINQEVNEEDNSLSDILAEPGLNNEKSIKEGNFEKSYQIDFNSPSLFKNSFGAEALEDGKNLEKRKEPRNSSAESSVLKTNLKEDHIGDSLVNSANKSDRLSPQNVERLEDEKWKARDKTISSNFSGNTSFSLKGSKLEDSIKNGEVVSVSSVVNHVNKLHLGKKRGRPVKKTGKKVIKSFDIKIKSKSDDRFSSILPSLEEESAKVLESCLLMGLGLEMCNSDALKFHCCNIYAPLDSFAKVQCWSELSQIMEYAGEEGIVFIGDFNCVRNERERTNCVYKSRDSEAFSDFIKSNALIDVKCQNSVYTWCGPNNKKSKLDRALISLEWVNHEDWIVKVLDRKTSDHRAILLCNTVEDSGPKPFRVFDIWLKDSELMNKIQVAWNSSNRNLMFKFKTVKNCIREWNKHVNGDINEKIEQLEKEQFQLEEAGGDADLISNVYQKLFQMYESRASMLKQKSRIQWDLQGDENSKFFHKVVNKNWCKNKILGIMWRGNWIQNKDRIKEAFFNHFRDFFKKRYDHSIFNLGSLLDSGLNQEKSQWLSQPFSMEELEEALNNSPADKAPGPDGFSMGSMKMLWPLIKDELLDCMIKFQTSGTLPGGMNSSFICLIPKCVSPKHVQEYRPISLINSSMKLLSKMLASRLSKVIGNIVSEEQTGFIKGRLITDGILMIGEIINSIKSKQSEGLIFKIDFEKAFDSVDWSFLFHLLEKLNFSYDWIRWIKVILKSSKTSILVNGSPTREFSPERGLRQGDPLSPLLFDLVAQVLSCMIKKAEQLGIIDGVKISNSSEVITHLQYADDTVILIGNSMKSVMGIKSILQGFQLLTGLKINFDKSQLYGIGQDKDLVGNWARILGCAVGGDSFIYLGMEVLKSSSSVRYWDPLIGKVKKKLANWKGKSISMAGRAVLLKAAIDSLPTYWMSLHKIPRTVIKDIDRIRRKFLWSYTKSNGEVSNKMHSLAWENVCRPKEEGGLGLKLLEEKNASMLFKWWHRCFTERSKLWNKMLKNKYGTHVWVDPGLVDKNKNMSATFRNICRIVWWDIPLSRFNSATFSLRNIFSIIDDSILNKAWKSVVAASLWYIWISRNNKVFNLSTIDKNSLINNVKMRVYSWLLSSGLIENDHWREWKHIPRSVIQQSWLRKREKLWEVCKKKYEIICLVDGAFLQGPKAGKGGCIKDRDGNILFIFFGPSNALNSFEAEWDAAIFMIKSVLEHKQKWNKICLCTDSIKVIKKLKRIKRSQLWGELGLPDILGVALDNFEFIHLGRELNLEADGLAKAGMQKAQMVKGWL